MLAICAPRLGAGSRPASLSAARRLGDLSSIAPAITSESKASGFGQARPAKSLAAAAHYGMAYLAWRWELARARESEPFFAWRRSSVGGRLMHVLGRRFDGLSSTVGRCCTGADGHMVGRAGSWDLLGGARFCDGDGFAGMWITSGRRCAGAIDSP